MNQITRRKRLQEQRNSYWEFLPFCNEEQGKKLMQEILRLDIKIEAINNMKLDELQKQVITHEITKESKLSNLKVDENQIRTTHRHSNSW